MSTYDLMASELREQRELAVATIQRQNELYESVSQQLQDALAERAWLQEALAEAQMQERARCLNVINSYAMHTQVRPHGAVGQALAAIINTIKGADNG